MFLHARSVFTVVLYPLSKLREAANFVPNNITGLKAGDMCMS